jgi:hypothetical protein
MTSVKKNGVVSATGVAAGCAVIMVVFAAYQAFKPSKPWVDEIIVEQIKIDKEFFEQWNNAYDNLAAELDYLVDANGALGTGELNPLSSVFAKECSRCRSRFGKEMKTLWMQLSTEFEDIKKIIAIRLESRPEFDSRNGELLDFYNKAGEVKQSLEELIKVP